MLESTPTRFRALCEKCNEPLDIREAGSHQFVSGWVKVREGGGGHGISLPERQHRWMHSWCVNELIREQTKGRPSGNLF
jgi:hypothetical protein